MEKNCWRKLNYFIVVLILIFSTGNFAFGEIVDRIVAVVDDDLITLMDLNNALKPYADRIKYMENPNEEEAKMLLKLREDILNNLINQKIEDEEIKKSKISISEKEIDEAIERVKEANSHTDEMLREALSREGIKIEDYRNKVKEQILRGKLVNIKVKSKIVIVKDDIKAYYESHPDEYGSVKKYHIKNILIKNDYEKMKEVFKRIKSGESFELLAKNYSESPFASEGGDLGLFKLEELSSNVQDLIKNMKKGDISDILNTEQGYQCFYLYDILETKKKSLSEAEKEIEEKLYQEVVEKKFMEWLTELRKQSHIKIIK
ncbi:MAG: SurA N-terminal domain-containing protein [Desulfobacterales bacterium]|nr:SurA N-terminal domain-containing protein [Desulfobacterales bacterium]MBF0396983.1 SurA N-terminal domain-containing protein [Desulfobacterales bacterium]